MTDLKKFGNFFSYFTQMATLDATIAEVNRINWLIAWIDNL